MNRRKVGLLWLPTLMIVGAGLAHEPVPLGVQLHPAYPECFPPVVARVAGDEITTAELIGQVQGELYWTSADQESDALLSLPTFERNLQVLVDRRVLAQHARQLGISVPDAQVAAVLDSHRRWVEGELDVTMDEWLEAEGTTLHQLEVGLRREMLAEALLLRALDEPSISPPREATPQQLRTLRSDATNARQAFLNELRSKTEISLHLPGPQIAVEGRVNGRDGKSIPNAQVEFQRLSAGGTSAGSLRTTSTGTGGRFEVSCLDPGEYELVVRHGPGPAVRRHLHIRSGDVTLEKPVVSVSPVELDPTDIQPDL